MQRLDTGRSHVIALLTLAAIAAGCADPAEPEGMTVVTGVIKQLPDVSSAYKDSATGHAVYCDYNGSSITLPGDPSPDLICVQCYDPYGTPAVDWWYSASDGSLNSWGWYSSGGAVNWGACLNPHGSAPDYTLSVGMRLTNGSAGPWFVSAIPCKRP
jgi:hypothetical protein